MTGGAGFIGSNLVSRLVDLGDSVSVIDDLSTGHLSNLDGSPATLHQGSILDRGMLSDALEGADAVVHLAALGSVPRSVKDPVTSHHANATGTLYVLEAARRRKLHVVAASSSSVYGSVPDLPRVESLPTRPMSPYAASKAATEAYVLAYGSSYGLPVLPFRFFNVYGPNQAAGHPYAAVIPTFINAALSGMPITVDGDGLQTRDFTYVDTVTWVLANAVHGQVISDRPVNLALGANVSIRALLNHLENILGRRLNVHHGPCRVGDVQASQADPTLLRQLFPDVPETPIDCGLRATVEWFLSTRAPDAAPLFRR